MSAHTVKRWRLRLRRQNWPSYCQFRASQIAATCLRRPAPLLGGRDYSNLVEALRLEGWRSTEWNDYLVWEPPDHGAGWLSRLATFGFLSKPWR